MTGGAAKTIGGLVLLLGMNPAAVSQSAYPWLDGEETAARTVASVTPPAHAVRLSADSTSFTTWLRNLPLLPDQTPVRLFNGDPKGNQAVHEAIIDIDVGSRDLQQCADATIRLRAEYLFSCHQHDNIIFRFTSGDTASWRQWQRGYRPVVHGNDVSWRQTAPEDSSYRRFREYLDTVFMYAGTISLNRDLKRKPDLCTADPGDLLLRGGSPGHAVMVIDVATDTVSATRYLLLAQSFMPAQNIHILKNPTNQSLSPWYPCDCDSAIVTPEWTFRCGDLRSF